MPHRGELRDGGFASRRAGDARTAHDLVAGARARRRAVRLRGHTDADLPRIVEACSDVRTRHWLVGVPAPYTPDDARARGRGRGWPSRWGGR